MIRLVDEKKASWSSTRRGRRDVADGGVLSPIENVTAAASIRKGHVAIILATFDNTRATPSGWHWKRLSAGLSHATNVAAQSPA